MNIEELNIREHATFKVTLPTGYCNETRERQVCHQGQSGLHLPVYYKPIQHVRVMTFSELCSFRLQLYMCNRALNVQAIVR